jgi:hypothetical protein
MGSMRVCQASTGATPYETWLALLREDERGADHIPSNDVTPYETWLALLRENERSTDHIPSNDVSCGGIKSSGDNDQVRLKLIGDRENDGMESSEVLRVASRAVRPPNVDIETLAHALPCVEGVPR